MFIQKGEAGHADGLLALSPKFNFNGKMLVKYHDRLTLDGALALQTPDGLQKLLDFARGQRRMPDQLTLPEKAADAVRFLRYDGQSFVPFNEAEVRNAIDGPIRVANIVADQRAPAEVYEKFLKSNAHHQLAFSQDPMVFGTLGKKYIFAVGEGQSGRKYRRTIPEIVDMFKLHPEMAEAVFPDLEMRIMFEQEIKNVADLERFLAGDLGRLDFVLDLVSLVGGHLGMLSAEIEKKTAWALALNDDASATLDFRFYDPPAHQFPHAGFKHASENLRSALVNILAFAKKNNVENEAKSFADALKMLDTKVTERGEMWGSFKGTVEGHTVEEAYRLFRAAVFADNFAGMSSWNDVQIEESEELHKVSNEVVISLLDALCASVDGLRT